MKPRINAYALLLSRAIGLRHTDPEAARVLMDAARWIVSPKGGRL